MIKSVICVWKHCWNLSGTGIEFLQLGDLLAQGTIVWTNKGKPFKLTYNLEWDERGCTRYFVAGVTGSDLERSIHLTPDGQGHWFSEEKKLKDLEGCLDIDLWPTPFTNTLPIRRLRIPAGTAAEIQVAYVEAPDLAIRAKAQKYTALKDGLYRFESLDDGFAANIEFDVDDLVQRYTGLFERIA